MEINLSPFSPTRRIKRGWMNLRVQRVYDETHDTKTFVLVDAEEGGRPFDFVAGQYLTFRFDDVDTKPVVRSYTMSGSPCQRDETIFTVKRIPGGLISNWLCDRVTAGSVLRARGPIGKFCYDASIDMPHLFMIAGGSGVTPFTSIMREYAGRLGTPGAPQSMHLLVAHRSLDDLINHRELLEAAAHQGVNYTVTLTRANQTEQGFWQGRPDDEMLKRFFMGRYADATVMSCGPQAIMDLSVAHARAHGVSESQIKVESFES